MWRELVVPNSENTVIGQDYCCVHTENLLKLRIKKSTITGAGKRLFAVGINVPYETLYYVKMLSKLVPKTKT